MTTKDLKKTFQEMIDVLTLVDKKTKEPLTVPAKAPADDLKEAIRKYAKFIEPEDEFTDETQAIIDSVVEEEEEEEEEETTDENEEEEEEVTEDTENEELIEEVEDAESIIELKEIVKENDILKPLRKGIGLVKEKDIEKFRKRILDILQEEEEETDVNEEKEETDVNEEKEVEEKSKKKTLPIKKETKKVKKEKGPSKTAIRVEFLTPLIKEGKYTKKELTNLYMKKHREDSESGVNTLLTDAKNPKYNKFPNPVIQTNKGTLKFEK